MYKGKDAAKATKTTRFWMVRTSIAVPEAVFSKHYSIAGFTGKNSIKKSIKKVCSIYPYRIHQLIHSECIMSEQNVTQTSAGRTNLIDEASSS